MGMVIHEGTEQARRKVTVSLAWDDGSQDCEKKTTVV